MVHTSVGLFDNASVAEAVVEALRSKGIPSSQIQVVAEPLNPTVDSATSTPAASFGASLSRSLSSMGATNAECEAYVAGVKQGNVLVLVTVSEEDSNAVLQLMNSYYAVEVEEFAGVAAGLPAANAGFTGAKDITFKEDRARAKASGARIFSW